MSVQDYHVERCQCGRHIKGRGALPGCLIFYCVWCSFTWSTYYEE